MSASAATFGLQPFRPLRSCMLGHFEDMPILNMIFGRSNTTAPLPKPLVKRRASLLKESPARDEEDETSDCPMEQVADENPSASNNQRMSTWSGLITTQIPTTTMIRMRKSNLPQGRPTSKAMPHPKLVPKSPPPTLEACVKGQASTEEHPGRGDGIRQPSW